MSILTQEMVKEKAGLPSETKLRAMGAAERIAWAYSRYGDKLAMSTSFGMQSAVLLHMATRVHPEIPVIFIDTGYLFSETYRFARDLTRRLDLNLRKYHPSISAAEQEALHGRLWEAGNSGIGQYNFVRKVEPMNRALQELGTEVWMAGLRRAQSSTRKHLKLIIHQKRIMEFFPIIDWTDEEVDNYLKEHDLPYHPLRDQGYVSVGDTHSTSRLLVGMRAEETRFNGVKRECGLHEPSGRLDFQI
jgi:phosphoadenosine phosphosulfate reductase